MNEIFQSCKRVIKLNVDNGKIDQLFRVINRYQRLSFPFLDAADYYNAFISILKEEYPEIYRKYQKLELLK